VVNAIDALKRGVGWLNQGLLWVCKALAVGLIVIMTAIIFTNVVFRYGFNDAIAWSEEIAKFVMVWMTFVAAPVGLKLGAHIAIDALANALKGRAFFLLQFIIFANVIALMAMFVDEAWFLTQNAKIQRASTIDLSIFYVYLAMPFGCTITALVAFEFGLNALKGLISPARADDMRVHPILANE